MFNKEKKKTELSIRLTKDEKARVTTHKTGTT